MSTAMACPDGHGPLLEGPWGERLFCPHAAHGGNGRFFRPSESKEMEMPTATRKATPAPKPSAKKRATTTSEPAGDREPCLCGCGGFPKGAKARFIPGHDARFHAAQKAAAAEAAAAEAAK